MAELLIFAKDWSAELKDPEQIANLPKLGDVIIWRPDGWIWSEQELKNPLFRIVKWEGKNTAELDNMLKSKHPILDKDQNQITAFQYRAKGFDLGLISVEMKDYFNDSIRVKDKINVTASFENALVERAEIPISPKPLPIPITSKII